MVRLCTILVLSVCICSLNAVLGAIEDYDTPDIRPLIKSMRSFRSANRVWMSVQEQELIESYLDENTTMLEYGSGFSTLWFSQFVKQYYSIEHSKEWYEAISAKISALPNVVYTLAGVDAGFKGWPGGFSEGNFDQFEEYIKAVDRFNPPEKVFDRVLIDGRARAFCAKYILKYLHKGSYIFIHDFQGRALYHDNLDAYYIRSAGVFEGQSVVVARPKPAVLQAVQEGNFPF